MQFMQVPEPTAESRNQFVNGVLQSQARSRVIVAGPGTGKSHLFRSEVAKYEEQPLLISFLRSLIEEMQPALGDKALVRTFHSFCKREFLKLYAGKRPGFRFHYPLVNQLIDQDLIVTGRASASSIREIENAMHAQRDHDHLEDWLGIAELYQAYGHTDLVYRVLKCIDDGDEVPSYPVVIVDEYQDLSPLERAFIERLADLSPTLIVGDDDQSLYDFKSAGPDGIRNLHGGGDAEVFWLPYCSRCTTVIVDAVHRLAEKAMKEGFLAGRIEKPFVCYTPDKEAESISYPKVIHAECSVQMKNAPYIAKYIEQEINKIPLAEIEHAWADATHRFWSLALNHSMFRCMSISKSACQTFRSRSQSSNPSKN